MAFAFSKSQLKSICIPSSVRVIESFCFARCSELNEIKFMENSELNSIGKSAFELTSITKIQIPPHVKVIRSDTFASCRKLQTVEFCLNSELRTIESNAFNYSNVKELIIPSCVDALEEGWISNTIELTSIKLIPSKIENLKYLNDSIIVHKLDPNQEFFTSILFASRDIEEVTIPSYIQIIESNAFFNCKLLRNVTFESNSKLISIEKCGFSNTRIENINIPSSLTHIGDCAFYGSKNLNEVICDANSKLRMIGMRAFTGTDLSKLAIPSSVTNLEEGWSCNTPLLNDITLIPSAETNVIYYQNSLLIGKENPKKEDFNCLLFMRRNIRKITIPSFIKIISSYSLCESLIECVNFANDSKLISIEKNAFSYTSIKKIMIPSSVAHIGDYAFSDCTLERIIFPNDSELTYIGESAFACSAIESISIPKHVTIIDKEAFCDCVSLQIIEISEDSELESFDIDLFEDPINAIVMIPVDFQGEINDE